MPPKIQGTWQPAAGSPGDLLILNVILTVTAVVHGIDYAIGPAQRAAVSGQAFPALVWAVSLWVGAATMTIGVVARRHFSVWLGHSLLALIYFALTLALIRNIADEPGWEGVRFAALTLIPCAIHFGLSLRTGPRPGPLHPSNEVVMRGGSDRA